MLDAVERAGIHCMLASMAAFAVFLVALPFFEGDQWWLTAWLALTMFLAAGLGGAVGMACQIIRWMTGAKARQPTP